MKITAAKCRLVRLPADEPLAGGPTIPGAVREIVTLELRTDAGIEGVGITFFGAAISRALLAAVEDLAAIAKGEDPINIEGESLSLARLTVSPDSELDGKTVGQIEDGYSVSIVLVRYDSASELHPTDSLPIKGNYLLAVLGRPDKLNALVHASQ